MFVAAALALQDIGDATSVSLLNLDASEHTPEVICLCEIIQFTITSQEMTVAFGLCCRSVNRNTDSDFVPRLMETKEVQCSVVVCRRAEKEAFRISQLDVNEYDLHSTLCRQGI